MSDLPVGWAESALIDLIGVDGLFSDGDWIESKDQDPNGTIRLLQLADIGDGKFLNKSHRFVNDEKFESLNCTQVLEGDVLVARMPDPLGRTCLMPNLPQKCITVVDVAIIRPGAKSVSTNWLMHFLNSPDIRQTIQLLSSGTTRKRISRSNLAQIKIPVPPLNEQKRIVEKLNTLLARIELCQSHLDRVPQILKRFHQSVLTMAMSGRLTEDWRNEKGISERWNATDVQSVAFVGTGSTPLRSNSSFYSSKGTPWVTSAATGQPFINSAKEFVTKKAIKAHRLKLYPIGAVIVAMYGEGKTRGQVSELAIKATLNQACAAIVVDETKVAKKYLKLALQANYLEMRELAEGGAQPNLNLTKIKEFTFPLPSFEEQAEIVLRVEKLFAYAERLEARYHSTSGRVEQLSPSLLAKAFRGELVEQDPNDEIAEKLLERIIEIRKIEQEKRKAEPRKKREKKMSTDQNQQPLYVILIASKGARLTPDQLFSASGYETSFREGNNNQEVLDAFYEELRSEIQKGRIREERPNSKVIYLVGVKS